VEPNGALGNITTVTPVLTTVLNLVNSIGDDKFSTADLTKLVDPSMTTTQHYGPYSSTSPDSGTCGNDWATDSFNRHFTVFQDRLSGSLLVVEQFKAGSFVTSAGPSPGACETSPLGSMVTAGVTGSLHGYFIIPLPGETQTSFDSSCVAGMPSTPCTTGGFINSHFTPACYPATCTVTTYFFHYTAPKPSKQGLIENEWKNASPDRGGDSGDIRST
jgi:hypothetical protein